MKKILAVIGRLSFLVGFISIGAWASGAESLDALLQKGIREFNASNYKAAADAFQQAEDISGEDHRISYNRGIALLKLGKADDAIEAFLQAALSPDAKLAIKSLIEIGNIHVSCAKREMTNSPELLETDVRKLVEEELASAVKYFEAAVDIDPDNQSIKDRIEHIRLWLERMRGIWKEKDRNAKHLRTPILEYLDEKQDELEKIRTKSIAFQDELGSPKKFQEMKNTFDSISDILAESAKITEMIDLHLSAEPPFGSPGHTEEMGPVNEKMSRFAKFLREGAEPLKSYKNVDPFGPMAKSIGELDEVQTLLKPYEKVLLEMIPEQEHLIQTSYPQTDGKSLENARRQDMIAQRLPILMQRANQGLTNFREHPHLLMEPSGPMLGTADEPGTTEDAVEYVRNLEKIKESMELAVKHLPEVVSDFSFAKKQLENGNFESAGKSQENGLELLRKIAEPLQDPPDDPPPKENDPDAAPNQNDETKDGNQEDTDNQPNDDEQQTGENQPDSGESDGEGESDPGSEDEQNADGTPEQDEPENRGEDDSPENVESETGEGSEAVTEGGAPEKDDDIEKLIRQVRRRQQDAEKQREDARKAIDNRRGHEVKDW